MSGQLNTELKSETLPILLRVPGVSDAKALLSILNNPLNTEFDPHAGSGNLQLSNVENMITRMRSSAAMEIPDRVNLVIVDTSLDNQVVGLGGFGHISTNGDERIGDAGIMLQPGARGKGYGVEAIKLTLVYAFDELKLNAVTLTMLKKNVAMWTLIDKKLKFQGIERDSEFGTEISYIVQAKDWRNTAI
ncbi:hypothetical protein NQZ79_g2682 [Umbelopsis isabellina]|nr:hypothetical protein NQZ79_g2682 [Umbelopsis isabellina]